VQVTFCVFNFAIGQRFASIVLPVSVSFDVDGQRTSKLLMLGLVFDFGRRGGSKKNRVAILESINDAGFGGVVRRHLHFHPVPNCKPNETFAHLPGNVRENEMIVRERNAKHGSGEHRHDGSLQLNGFFRIHSVVRCASFASNVGPENFSGPTFKPLYRRKPAK
jgi:hypothetical protein